MRRCARKAGQLAGQLFGAPGKLAGVWDATQRAAMAARFAAIEDPYARDVAARVLDGLDAQARSWGIVHRDTCLAHRRGEESDGLLDRKMRCLDRQRADLAAAVAVLQQSSGSSVERAVDVVISLSPSAWCADSTRVLDDAEPPATPALDRRVRELRARISTAAALDRDGRSEDAAAVARATVTEAERSGYPPLVAEADLELGRILIAQTEVVPAVLVLRSARDAALATGRQPRLVVEAGARLIYAEGAQAPDVARLERDLAILEPMSRSLAGDHFARPLLLNNIAEVYRIANRLDAARYYLRLAKDALGSEPPDIELTVIDRNLATLTPDPVVRLQLARGAWTRTGDMLGAHHLRSLQAQAQYAVFDTEPGRACALLAPVCDEYRQYHPALTEALIDCEVVNAFLASESGRSADAHRAYDAILKVVASSQDPDHVVYRRLATAERALLDHEMDRAVPEFRAVIEARGKSAQWWVKQQALQAELGLGLVAVAQHHIAEAVGHLEVAATGYAAIAQLNPGLMYSLRAIKANGLLAAIQQSPERDVSSRH